MSKVKKLQVHFEIWGQSWRGEVWANSIANARHNCIQEVIKGPDVKNRLRVRVREGNKEIVFFDRVFRVENRLWPDDMEEFRQWACEAFKKQLKARPYVKPVEA